MFVNWSGPAIHIQPHNGTPGYVRVFGNTVLAIGVGIYLNGGDRKASQTVAGNAVFAAAPIDAATQFGNFSAPYSHATRYMVRPTDPLDTFDPSPIKDALNGTPVSIQDQRDLLAASYDFNGRKRDLETRGAMGSASKPWKWEQQCLHNSGS